MANVLHVVKIVYVCRIFLCYKLFFVMGMKESTFGDMKRSFNLLFTHSVSFSDMADDKEPSPDGQIESLGANTFSGEKKTTGKKKV